MISALATSFDLPIYILPVGSLLSDTTMAHAMSGIGSKCILVLEDIHALFTLDKANKSQARSDDSWFGTGNRSTATLSTLLNVLDGLDSGEARITIATSNVAPSRMFDDALCRPGRFDRFFHFKNASREQARELFLTFYKGSPGVLDDRSSSGAEDIWRLAKKWEAMIEEEQFSVAALQGKNCCTQHTKTWLTPLLQAISSLIKTTRKALWTPCLDSSEKHTLPSETPKAGKCRLSRPRRGPWQCRWP